MEFRDFAGSSLFFSFMLPIILFICGLFFLNRVNGQIQEGTRRNRLFFLLIYGLSVYVFSFTGALPIPEEISGILSRLAFFGYFSFPLIFNLSHCENHEKSTITQWLITFFTALLLILSLFGKWQSVVPIFSAYIPGILIALFRVWDGFVKSATPPEQNFRFKNLCLQITASSGPLLDFILIPGSISLPLFGPFFQFWVLKEISAETPGKEEQFLPGKGIGLIIPPAIITLCVLGLNMYYDVIIGQDLNTSARYAGIVLFALSGSIVWFYGGNAVMELVNRYSRRFVHELILEMNRLSEDSTLIGIKDLKNIIERNFEDVRHFIFIRPPYWKTMKIMEQEGRFFEEDCRLIIPSPMAGDFTRKGYSCWTPENVEIYANRSSFYTRATRLMEQSDLLFMPVIYNLSDGMPGFVILFLRSRNKMFKPVEIQGLFTLSGRMAPSAMDFYRQNYSVEFPLSNATDTLRDEKSFLIMLESDLKNLLPLENLMLIGGTKRENFEIRHSAGSVSESDRELIFDMAGRFRQALEKDGSRSVMISVNTRNCSVIIDVPSIFSREMALLLSFSPENFYFEQDLEKHFTGFGIRVGLILDRINMAGDLEMHRLSIMNLNRQLESQRLNVAEELHDTVAQEIYAAKMTIQLLERQIDTSAGGTREDLLVLKGAVTDGLSQVRSLIGKLRNPSAGEKNDIVGELKTLVERIEKEGPIRFHVEGLPLLKKISADISRDIYLSVREAINNARKHSHAENVHIRITEKNRRLTIYVEDDGTGFDPAKHENTTGKFGLKSLREKIERTGGKLTMKSEKNAGTRVSMEISKLQEY